MFLTPCQKNVAWEPETGEARVGVIVGKSDSVGCLCSFFQIVVFKLCCKSSVEHECAERVSLFGSSLGVKLFASDVGVHCYSLLVVKKLCGHLYEWLLDALFSQGHPHAAVLNCVECLVEINGCDPKSLVPLGGSPSELLVRQQVVCRRVAQSEAWLVNTDIINVLYFY